MCVGGDDTRTLPSGWGRAVTMVTFVRSQLVLPSFVTYGSGYSGSGSGNT